MDNMIARPGWPSGHSQEQVILGGEDLVGFCITLFFPALVTAPLLPFYFLYAFLSAKYLSGSSAARVFGCEQLIGLLIYLLKLKFLNERRLT